MIKRLMGKGWRDGSAVRSTDWGGINKEMLENLWYQPPVLSGPMHTLETGKRWEDDEVDCNDGDLSKGLVWGVVKVENFKWEITFLLFLCLITCSPWP